mgnify:CR=1 FL=1
MGMGFRVLRNAEVHGPVDHHDEADNTSRNDCILHYSMAIAGLMGFFYRVCRTIDELDHFMRLRARLLNTLCLCVRAGAVLPRSRRLSGLAHHGDCTVDVWVGMYSMLQASASLRASLYPECVYYLFFFF